MFKSLLYKEWLKIKWVIIGLTVINVAVILNIYLDLGNFFKEFAANAVVGQLQAYEITFYSDIKNIILATGLLIGVFQFYPEINQSKLKLTFHLPVKENIILMQMAGFGTIIIATISLIDMLLLSIVTIKYLPHEFYTNMLMTTLPWYLGSLCVYFWIVVIFIEPNWTKRILTMLVAYGVVSLFYAGEGYSKYSYSILYFALLTILSGSIIFLSAYNFKRGIC